MASEFRPVITSLLDTDLYKFTMMQVILHQQPQIHSEYKFRCRNVPQQPLSRLKGELEAQLDHLCSLRFSDEELDYLGHLRFIKSDFVEFLRLFHLQRKFITVSVSEAHPDDLDIRVEGPMLHCMLFEIYVLSIVNELHFRQFDTPEVRAEGLRRLKKKIETLKAVPPVEGAQSPFIFFDFGTRRRFSKEWHAQVIATLMADAGNLFRGTSNVRYAMDYGTTPIGTMAHEYMQAFQSFGSRLRDFQKNALEHWVQEYRGDLGTALTDVVGMDAFLRDFDLYFCKLFDGIRHDSGDPIEWGEKALAHYARHRIDARTKMLVFSDGLSFPRAAEIYQHFAGRARTSFGLGTNLTNDCGLDPLQIVIKLVRCNGQPVAKVSDTPGKNMGEDATFLNYLHDVFQIPRTMTP